MERVPKSSIPSMAQKMMGLRIKDKAEKALFVRIGTLIDAIVESQRGHNNPGAVNRRQNVNNLKKPKALTGSTENVFNGAQVTINASSSSANLSHYEAEISENEAFPDPTRKEIFTTTTTFKGLTENRTYHVRIRPVTKDGQIGDWALLDQIVTTPGAVAAEFDGTILSESRESVDFTFDSSGEQMFMVACVPAFTADAEGSGSANTTRFRSLRDDSGSDTIIETITYAGQAGSTEGITLNNPSEDLTGHTTCEIYRGQALGFFNLIDPSSAAGFPVVHNFEVEFSQSGGAYARSTNPIVWVKF